MRSLFPTNFLLLLLLLLIKVLQKPWSVLLTVLVHYPSVNTCMSTSPHHINKYSGTSNSGPSDEGTQYNRPLYKGHSPKFCYKKNIKSDLCTCTSYDFRFTVLVYIFSLRFIVPNSSSSESSMITIVPRSVMVPSPTGGVTPPSRPLAPPPR